MAPALEVADIFRRHGEAFRQAHAGHLGASSVASWAPSRPAGRRRSVAMSSNGAMGPNGSRNGRIFCLAVKATTDSRDSICFHTDTKDRDRAAAHLLSDQKRLLALIWIFRLYAFVAATIGSLTVATVSLKKVSTFAISILVAFAM